MGMKELIVLQAIIFAFVSSFIHGSEEILSLLVVSYVGGVICSWECLCRPFNIYLTVQILENI